MYVIIGSHFVSLEGKFLLIALVISWITLNGQTLKQFDNVFATGGNNIVEEFESLTSF
jgi:hypothetical protein